MSRAKQRKQQRKEEQSNQSRVIAGGGLLAILIGVIGFFVLQGESTPSGPVFSEDGRLIWQTMELRNAVTGETFMLADFDESDVVVKIMSPF